jgi:transcriptional regulator of arginine metabolism
MMRQKRHNAILVLIKDKVIETQKDLTSELTARGFNVTQATVSRDIKELRLIKKQTEDGRYRYVQPSLQGISEGGSRVKTIFSHSVIKVDYALNSVVIKTLPGMAQAAAITLEAMDWQDILGTVGGDDTVLVIMRNERSAALLKQKLSTMIDMSK